MKRLFPILLILAGCSDGLFGPDAANSIDIEIEASGVSEATLLVGETVALGVSISGGRRGQSVAWRSDNPAIVSVSEAGVATGVAEGDSRIIADAGGVRDTVLITVLAGAPAGGHCAGNGGLRLTRGQSYTTSARSAATLCVVGADRFEQYVLVPFNAVSSGESVQVEIADLRPATSPLMAPEAAITESLVRPATLLPTGPVRSMEADRKLRQTEVRELSSLVVGRGGPRGSSLPYSAAAMPIRGEVVTLNVNPEKPCTAPTNRKARVAAVSRNAIILHDQENPEGGFTDEEYAGFAARFDELVHPTVIRNFGEPTDIDGNGRIMIVFTRAVNEMTAAKADAYVAGFFFSRDLFPKSDGAGLRGCATSNAAEILYLMTPDVRGEVNGNIRSRAFVNDRTMGVIAHELQHLVGASRRLRILGVENWNEDFWLNEGMSHIAEELTFYGATGKTPRQDIRLDDLPIGSTTLDHFNQFQWTNFSRFSSYLRTPGGTSPVAGVALETRGASWAFLRYAADRRGGSETEFWRALVDSGALGYENLALALGVSPLGWVHDWTASLYVDNLTSQASTRFQQPSWNFRSIMPAIPGNGSGYPLRIEELRPGVLPEVELELAGGAAAIVRFSISGEGRAVLRTTSGGAAPPPQLRLTLIRTR